MGTLTLTVCRDFTAMVDAVAKSVLLRTLSASRIPVAVVHVDAVERYSA
jgi:hypothetical protein